MGIKEEIEIGGHRLILGDCLDILPLLGEVDMVLTDMPYGTTACNWDTVLPLDKIWDNLRNLVKPSGAIVMTASQPFTSRLISSNYEMFKYCWVWDKIKGTGFLNAKKMPMRNHEDIAVFYSKPPIYNPQMTAGHKRKMSFRSKHLQTDVYGDMGSDVKYDSTVRYPRSVQVISTDTQTVSVHPTQKPVALMEYFIKTYTNIGDTVLDFTMGSGTTIVACENLGRKGIGVELDKKYFNIAHERVKEVIL